MGWVRSLPDANVCQRSLPTVFRKGAVFGKGACRQSFPPRQTGLPLGCTPPHCTGTGKLHRHTAHHRQAGLRLGFTPPHCTGTGKLHRHTAHHRQAGQRLGCRPPHRTATLHTPARLSEPQPERLCTWLCPCFGKKGKSSICLRGHKPHAA